MCNIERLGGWLRREGWVFVFWEVALIPYKQLTLFYWSEMSNWAKIAHERRFAPHANTRIRVNQMHVTRLVHSNAPINNAASCRLCQRTCETCTDWTRLCVRGMGKKKKKKKEMVLWKTCFNLSIRYLRNKTRWPPLCLYPGNKKITSYFPVSLPFPLSLFILFIASSP